jgi:hypothetical protein
MQPPRSLATLELRIGKGIPHQIITLQDAVLNILGRLAEDVRAQYPVLTKLILRWVPGHAYHYDPRKHQISTQMKRQGVEVVLVNEAAGEQNIELDAVV